MLLAAWVRRRTGAVICLAKKDASSRAIPPVPSPDHRSQLLTRSKNWLSSVLPVGRAKSNQPIRCSPRPRDKAEESKSGLAASPSVSIWESKTMFRSLPMTRKRSFTSEDPNQRTCSLGAKPARLRTLSGMGTGCSRNSPMPSHDPVIR